VSAPPPSDDPGGGLVLRPIEPADRPVVLAMNEGDVHHLSPLDDARLVALLGWAARSGVVVTEGDPTVLGFVLTFAPGTPYDSTNYTWFGDRLDAFLYLDRIVVAGAARRRGVASFVYGLLEAEAWREHGGPLVCEVDVEPLNEASLAFHRSRGFEEVGRQVANGKTVALLRSP
jgi:predicted GNAT superfamily acetyltransferase